MDRADDIAAAIGRFEQRATTGDHDGRLIAENLGTEVGFGGSAASRRQQVQQYFACFPHLRQRWGTTVDEAKTRAGQPRRDLLGELAATRAEAARLREQLPAMDRVADLWRRKAERFERQLQQRQLADAASPANVVELRPPPEPTPGELGTHPSLGCHPQAPRLDRRRPGVDLLKAAEEVGAVPLPAARRHSAPLAQ